MDQTLSQTALNLRWLGLVPYNEALALQNRACDHVRQYRSTYVLGLEHPAVVTLGKRGVAERDLVANCSFSVMEVDRGGQATLHSPGQLVVYPILALNEWSLGVRQYVEILQKVTIASLAFLGIHSVSGDAVGCGPGIYTERGKIAFIGVRVERGIAYHGISINVFNDLDGFQQIRSCGIQNARVDRIGDYRQDISLRDLFFTWSSLLQKQLLLTSTQGLRHVVGKSSVSVVGSALP